MPVEFFNPIFRGVIGGLTALYGIYRSVPFAMDRENGNGNRKWGVAARDKE